MPRNAPAKRRVPVVLGEDRIPVGLLVFEARGAKQGSAFRYADSWLARSNRFALSPQLPLTSGWSHHWSAGKETHAALPGPVSDCAPDAWGRSLVAARLGRPPSELEALLGVNDATRMGALRFLDKAGKPMSLFSSPIPNAARLPDIRTFCRIAETGLPEEVREAARQLRGAGDSLGGARPKSDFVDRDGTLHLAKYTSERDTLPVARMEVATLKLARAVGIRASQARLALPDEAYPVALIKRFDREGPRRKHYVSGRSFIGDEAAQNAYYTELVEQMSGPCAERFLTETRELHSRILYMILVSNTDDHMKNHGFLYTGRGWALSPMFDVNPQPGREPQMKTGISPLSGFEPSIEAAIEAAPFFEITEDEARERALGMAQAIRETWREHCRRQGMTHEQIAAYRPAFEHPEMDVALRLGAARTPAPRPRATAGTLSDHAPGG